MRITIFITGNIKEINIGMDMLAWKKKRRTARVHRYITAIYLLLCSVAEKSTFSIWVNGIVRVDIQAVSAAGNIVAIEIYVHFGGRPD